MAFTNKMLQFFPSVFIFHRSLSKPTQGCVSVSFLFSAPTCSSAWAPSTELDLGMRWGGGYRSVQGMQETPVSLGTLVAWALLYRQQLQ